MSTESPDNVVHIASSGSTQLFAIGTSNVGATRTIVVSGDTGGVALPLDPATNRVSPRLKQAGVLRGATSAAVCTMPNAGC